MVKTNETYIWSNGKAKVLKSQAFKKILCFWCSLKSKSQETLIRQADVALKTHKEAYSSTND